MSIAVHIFHWLFLKFSSLNPGLGFNFFAYSAAHIIIPQLGHNIKDYSISSISLIQHHVCLKDGL
jgi:hypothetical protein